MKYGVLVILFIVDAWLIGFNQGLDASVFLTPKPTKVQSEVKVQSKASLSCQEETKDEESLCVQ